MTCPNGHPKNGTNTRGDGRCRRCLAAARRRWLARNADQQREAERRWRQGNVEKQRARCRRWYYAHHEEQCARMRQRDHLRKASYSVPFTADQLAARMAYYGNRCYLCGGPFEHVDHAKPLSKGGPHMLANLRPACARCNVVKGNRWPYAQETRLERARPGTVVQLELIAS